MVDEKENMDSVENKTTEPQSLPGQGDLSPLEENNAPAIFGEDTPAPSGKVINLSELQFVDNGKKEGSAPTAEKKAPGPSPERAGCGVCGKKEKMSRGKKADRGKETGFGGASASKSAKSVKPDKAALIKETAAPPGGRGENRLSENDGTSSVP